MAYLRCFYCNKKSATKFTGQSQWECKACSATNFLDKKGEITDPPVATFKTAPVDLRHFVLRSESPPSRPSSPGSNSAVFCSTCIQNQNLYIKSLAQYDFDTDTDRPGYKQDERKFFEYRKALELRYPQVCGDCEPIALGMMKDANKVAKNDYLRRLMEKSRGSRLSARMRGFTFYGSLIAVGKYCWYAGVYVQLFWHIMALALTVQHNLFHSFEAFLPLGTSNTLSGLSDYFGSLSMLKSWAYYSLLVGLLSLWWNPRFKDIERGVPNHIKGYGDWYKQAAILLAIRGFIFYVTGTNALSDPFASVTMTCHGFAVLFIAYLVTAVHYTLKVDVTPLWETTPEKFKSVGPKAPERPYNPSMNEVLNDISKAVGRPRLPSTPIGGSFEFTRSPSISPTQLALEREKAAFARYRECEAMDWHPTPQPVSQHRAFAPDQPLQRSTQLFGQAPVAVEKSTFWYKVPPAPITPAHRLRNPPNQPRLHVASAESKDKLLVPLGKKIPTLQPKSEPSQEFIFAQQKFFPTATPGVDESDLADMMTGFSFKEDFVPVKTGIDYWPFISCATIFGALAVAWTWYRGTTVVSL